MRKAGFGIGSRVRVCGQRRIAKIWAFYSGIRGGVVLDREILGFRSWNVQDLAKARGESL